MEAEPEKRVAVLIPCYNEEATIAKVIGDFKRELPDASIYVFDNCSTDATSEIAREHGALVHKEPRQGKGFAVDSMFDRVDADIYVMVDGDDTYPASRVHDLIAPVAVQDADMTVGTRLSEFSGESFRPLHVFGNNLVRLLVNWITGAQLHDIMSGYRAFSRRVVERIPIVSTGFEVETEMTLQVLYYRLKIQEIEVPYKERPEGSESKLRTFRDGARVLYKIFTLFRAFKPLTFFGGLGLVFLAGGLAAGALPVLDYLSYQYVYHVPLAILATGLVLLAGGFVFLGVLLHALNWRILELHSVLTRRHWSR